MYTGGFINLYQPVISRTMALKCDDWRKNRLHKNQATAWADGTRAQHYSRDARALSTAATAPGRESIHSSSVGRFLLPSHVRSKSCHGKGMHFPGCSPRECPPLALPQPLPRDYPAERRACDSEAPVSPHYSARRDALRKPGFPDQGGQN